MLQITNLRKTYNGKNQVVNAIKDISLTINKGEIISFVGPSGCGKTTLLKLCAELIEPTSGEIKLEHNKSSIVFQKPTLLPWKTVKDNILLPVQLQNKKTNNCDKIIKTVGLKDFELSHPYELSGGMQQRVNLARALIKNPSVLLMDEPFASLDELMREKLNLELLKIWKKFKPTILFVTHSIQEAVFLSDRVVILSKQPTTVKEEVNIDLPKNRSLDIINTQEFQSYVKWIRDKID